MGLEPGMSLEFERPVSDDMTAHHFGNEGFHVLATPVIVAWFEEAARKLAAAHLVAGLGTVGALITTKHLAATPVGMTVRVKATLREINGRRLMFELEAYDQKEKIAEGQNERFVVQMARFREKLASKQQS